MIKKSIYQSFLYNGTSLLNFINSLLPVKAKTKTALIPKNNALINLIML